MYGDLMKSSQHKRASHFEPVAITRLGIIVPGAYSVQEYWELLCSSRSSGQVIDELARGLPVRIGCAVGRSAADLIDRKAAPRQDRVSHLATVAGLAALEDARLTGAAKPERASVFVGDTFGGAASLHHAYLSHCNGERLNRSRFR